jgi:hypothetical protein
VTSLSRPTVLWVNSNEAQDNIPPMYTLHPLRGFEPMIVRSVRGDADHFTRPPGHPFLV